MNSFIYQWILLYLCLNIVTLNDIASSECINGCAYCKQPRTQSCISCQNQYELNTLNNCISDSKIPNCVIYDVQNMCLKCRPSFKLTNSQCMKLFDSCLQATNFGLCSTCIQGVSMNKAISTCNFRQLNCEILGRNNKCVKCLPGYSLSFSRNICINNSTLCARTQSSSGLCNLCKYGYTLIGYECFRTQNIKNLTNCYLMYQNILIKTIHCMYCKQNYIILNGLCIPSVLIAKVNLENKCDFKYQYFDQILNICAPVPLYCKNFDYGYKKCLLCEDNKIQIEGVCFKDSHKFCKIFVNSNSSQRQCLICQEKYYLNDQNDCIRFPAYCEEFSNNKCVRCIQTFLLNTNSLCIDPNCNQVNPISGQCIQCKSNFIQDLEQICRYLDPFCMQSRNFTCILCRQSYQLDKKSGICVFLDKNCIKFSTQGICIQCNKIYYYNVNTQRCMILPDNCLSADQKGRCNLCNKDYALITTFQCMKISPLPNCRLVDQLSTGKCRQCNSGFYTNLIGKCQILPFFCKQFDSVQGICKICSQNGKMSKNNKCIDRFCQYPDSQGQCFGCLAGYQFGKNGQCIPQKKDPNCKQFQFNQCKKCSDRYYFDKQWNCVSVSNLCRQYDQNSGLCTKCYSGYKLSIQQQGQCLLSASTNQQISKISACKRIDQKNQKNCLQCQNNYQLVQTQTFTIICIKISQPSTIDFCVDLKDGICMKCITRMFVNNQGKCQQIDQFCQSFSQNNGSCFKCYPGYSLSQVQNLLTNQKLIKCILKIDGDPNCKVLNLSNGICDECYQGFFYNSQKKLCQKLDRLCENFNLTNGFCLTCYSGYSLINNQCILSNFTGNKNEINQFLCLKFNDSNKSKCQECIWGYVLIQNMCNKVDINCKNFKNQSSLQCIQCYSGYVIGGKFNQYCILQNSFILNCQIYDQKFNCAQCRPQFILSKSISGKIICQLIQ